MKSFLAVLTIILMMGAKAQTEKPFNWQITVEGEINASAAQTWDVLGTQFDKIDTWFSVVEHSRATTLSERPEGVTIDQQAPVQGRYTETSFAKAFEYLVAYDDQGKHFTFEAFGAPKFMIKKAMNTTSVRQLPNGKSKVSVEVNMRFSNVAFFMKGMMKKRMTRMFEKMFIELDSHLSTTLDEQIASK